MSAYFTRLEPSANTFPMADVRGRLVKVPFLQRSRGSVQFTGVLAKGENKKTSLGHPGSNSAMLRVKGTDVKHAPAMGFWRPKHSVLSSEMLTDPVIGKSNAFRFWRNAFDAMSLLPSNLMPNSDGNKFGRLLGLSKRSANSSGRSEYASTVATSEGGSFDVGGRWA